jgi:hypothetical protein
MKVRFGKVREDPAKQERWLGILFSLATVGLVILSWASVRASGQSPAPEPSRRVLVLYSDERLLPANASG